MTDPIDPSSTRSTDHHSLSLTIFQNKKGYILERMPRVWMDNHALKDFTDVIHGSN